MRIARERSDHLGDLAMRFGREPGEIVRLRREERQSELIRVLKFGGRSAQGTEYIALNLAMNGISLGVVAPLPHRLTAGTRRRAASFPHEAKDQAPIYR